MERKAFIIRAANGAALHDCADALRALAQKEGVNNFSVWGIEDLLLCYGEDAGDGAGKLCDAMLSRLPGAGLLAAPEALRPRMVRLLADRLDTGKKDWTAAHLEMILALAEKGRDGMLSLPGAEAVCRGFLALPEKATNWWKLRKSIKLN